MLRATRFAAAREVGPLRPWVAASQEQGWRGASRPCCYTPQSPTAGLKLSESGDCSDRASWWCAAPRNRPISGCWNDEWRLNYFQTISRGPTLQRLLQLSKFKRLCGKNGVAPTQLFLQMPLQR